MNLINDKLKKKANFPTEQKIENATGMFYFYFTLYRLQPNHILNFFYSIL